MGGVGGSQGDCLGLGVLGVGGLLGRDDCLRVLQHEAIGDFFWDLDSGLRVFPFLRWLF